MQEAEGTVRREQNVTPQCKRLKKKKKKKKVSTRFTVHGLVSGGKPAESRLADGLVATQTRSLTARHQSGLNLGVAAHPSAPPPPLVPL